jgi:hypothetical protein
MHDRTTLLRWYAVNRLAAPNRQKLTRLSGEKWKWKFVPATLAVLTATVQTRMPFWSKLKLLCVTNYDAIVD